MNVGWNRPRLRRFAAVALCVVLIGGFGVASASSKGEHSRALQLGAGQAWFGSPSAGSIALIDGSTGTRVTRVEVAAAGSHFDVVQARAAALVVNRDNGTLTRIDGAQWSKSGPVRVGSPGDEQLSVHVGGDVAWVISQQATVIQQFDTRDLSMEGSPQTAPGAISGVAATASGILWLTDATGNVRSYRDGGQLTSSKVDDVQQAELVLAGERPVIVDRTKRSAQVLDSDTGKTKRRLCLDVPADSLLALSTRLSPWVLAMAVRAGTLLVSNVDTGDCDPIVIGDSADTVRYGRPVEKDRLVFVPDFSTGEIIVIDPTLEPERRLVRRIDTGLRETHFELEVHDGHVWFDDPSGDTAGVITPELTALAVSKGDKGPEGVVPQVQGGSGSSTPRISCTHTPSVALPGQQVTFDAFSTDPSRRADRYEWNITGGAPSTAKGPQAIVSFDAVGDKDVSVIGFFGSSSEIARCPITIGQAATAPLSDSTNDAPRSGSPSGSVGGPSGSGSTPSGSTGSGQLPVPSDSTEGLELTPPPVMPAFTASPTSGVTDEDVTFADVTVGEHRIVEWLFPEGVITSGGPTSSTVKVKWSTPGTYAVTLTIETAEGPRSTQQSIDVNTNPTIPNLRGYTYEDAVAELTALGVVPIEASPDDSIVPAGRTVRTEPPGGTTVARGSSVEVVPSTGRAVANTVAGPAAPASLDRPARLAADFAGNVYVADWGHNQVKKIAPDGTTTVVAGTGAAGFAGDGGPATSAMLRNPIAVVLDWQGNIFIADEMNYRVRRVDVAGVITTVAGNGNTGATGDGGPATLASIDRPTDVDFDPASGNLVITTRWVRKIRTVDSTGVIGSLSSSGPISLVDPASIEFALGGVVMFVAEPHAHRILSRIEVNGAGVYLVTAGTGTDGFNGDGLDAKETQLSNPDALRLDDFGNLYFPDWGNNRIRKFATDGKIYTVAGTGTPGFNGDSGLADTLQLRLNDPCCSSGIVFDSAGALYLSDVANGRVRRLD